MSGASVLWKQGSAASLAMRQLLGVQGDTAQRFHIGLRVDQRRGRGGVIENCGDDVKRFLRPEKLGGQGVVQ